MSDEGEVVGPLNYALGYDEGHQAAIKECAQLMTEYQKIIKELKEENDFLSRVIEDS